MAKSCVLKILDEVNIKFEGLDPNIRRDLVKELKFDIPGARFMDVVKAGRWDGKESFFTSGGRSYLNLLDILVSYVERNGYEITEVDDQRAPHNFDFSPIDENILADRSWPVGHPHEGESIILRDYQVKCVNDFLSNQQCIQEISTAAGKCQPFDSMVLTDSGWKTMGDISYDDLIVTPRGKKEKIKQIYEPGNKDIYEIIFSDGRKARCCEDHLWKVYNIGWKTETRNGGPWRIISTSDLIKQCKKTTRRISIPLPTMEFDDNNIDLPLDPWLMGFLIGDGCFRNTISFSTSDREMVEKVKSKLIPGYTIKHIGSYDYSIIFENIDDRNHQRREYLKKCNKINNSLLKGSFHYYNSVLIELGLFNHYSYDKFIPDIYFSGSLEQRMEIIRGLVDSDGTIDKKSVYFSTTSKQLAHDFQRLVRSVGGIAKISFRKNKKYKYKGEYKSCRDAYIISTRFPEPWKLVSLQRKRQLIGHSYQYGKTLGLHIVNIQKVSNEPVRCLLIDDDEHLYLTDDYIVTHNTLITATLSHIIEQQTGGRTLIIVPNKFLVGQTAKDYQNIGLDVGVYFGDQKDIGNQHTICTWQSLNNLEKMGNVDGLNVMNAFLDGVNCIIVDETHLVKASVLKSMLSNSMSHIPIRWGLTGTLPEDEYSRTCLLVCIGNTINYLTAKELQDKGVLAECHVNIVQLQDKIGEFQLYPQELKFLVTDPRRVEYLAKSIKKISESGNTLVLVDRLKAGQMLEELIEDSIFLSGDDKNDVREYHYEKVSTNDNKIIIATYGIASTGVNIPRVFNLVMIEPGKSYIKVIQSIGRGIRKAKDKDFVNIWDFTSSLRFSKRHLTKRKSFYKKVQYPFNVTKVVY